MSTTLNAAVDSDLRAQSLGSIIRPVSARNSP